MGEVNSPEQVILDVVKITRVREAKAKKTIGSKVVGGKKYTYEYFTLPLNLYIKKHIVEKYGTDFIVELDEDSGVIIIRPKKVSLHPSLKRTIIEGKPSTWMHSNNNPISPERTR